MKKIEGLNKINDLRRKYYLKRERISKLLEPQQGNNIIKIMADSGYGKTRAMLDYIEKAEGRVVWVTLTPSDNYLADFWKHMIKSIKMVSGEAAAKMKKMGFPEGMQMSWRLLAEILDDIHEQTSTIFVIDDFHNIKNKRIQEFLDFFTSIEKEYITFYIVSRYETDFLDERAGIQVITGQQLKFSPEETMKYFIRRNVQLPPTLLKEAIDKTDGWPFAVYLVSLAVEHNQDLIDHSIHFSNQLIFDTIESEIFSHYSEQEQRFLLRMSLLDFYPVQMIDELYGNEVLQYYDKLGKNIFIRYSPNRQTYLCHQLFKEFLNIRQEMLTKEETEHTYKEAGRWFYEHDMAIDAIRCYRRLGDYEELWRIISDMLPGYYEPEFAEVLIDTIYEFPEEFKEQNPGIYVTEAALYSALGNMEREEALSLEIIAKLQKEIQTAEIRNAIGDAYLNLAFCQLKSGEPELAVSFRKAAEYLEGESVLYRSSYLFMMNGEPVTFRNGAAGELEEMIAALEEAEPYYIRVLGGGMSGMAVLAKAMGLYYQGEMNRAEEYARQAIYQGSEYGQIDIVCCALFLLMRLAAFKGDYQLLMEAMEQIQSYQQSGQAPVQLIVPEVAQAAFLVKMEIDDHAPDWILSGETHNRSGYLHMIGFERIIKANSMINKGRYYEVIPYLHQTEQMYRQLNRYVYIIHVHILMAVAYYNINDMNETAAHLYTSYKMSYQNNIVMLYATYGKYTRSMLSGIKKLKAAKTNMLTEENKEKLMLIPDQWIDMVITKASTFAKRVSLLREQFLAEHPEIPCEQQVLTEREKQILTAVCEGLTREEIADNMSISINTVKSILSNIYVKLDAINSAHAVRIAMLRGII